jgi:hypothetical protein
MTMPPSPDATALADALVEDDPAAVAALLDALHGRYLLRDGRLLDLLRPLVARGEPLDGVTVYRESGLRVLSRPDGGREVCDESRAAFVLDVERPRWRRDADGTP